MHYHWKQTTAKKKRDLFEQRGRRQAKMMCNLCGWLERQKGSLYSFF